MVFTSLPNAAAHKIGISVTGTPVFEILTDKLLNKVPAVNKPYNSINSLLRNFTGQSSMADYPFISGYVDLFPIRNIYISATGMGNHNTLSMSGDRSIVKQVPVNSGYGEMIFDKSIVVIDYLDCSRQYISRIGFVLKDIFGIVIDLHDNHWSFSIVFSRIQDL